MGKCKITVLRTLYFKDLADAYPPHEKGPCEQLKEGDVFYTSGPFGVDMPEGFCKLGSHPDLCRRIGLRREGLQPG